MLASPNNATDTDHRQVYRAAEVPDETLAALESAEPQPESKAVERTLADEYERGMEWHGRPRGA